MQHNWRNINKMNETNQVHNERSESMLKWKTISIEWEWLIVVGSDCEWSRFMNPFLASLWHRNRGKKKTDQWERKNVHNEKD